MDQNIVQQGNRRAAAEVAAAAMDSVARQQHPPPQPCPRCNSTNTKFCYYNNYSLSQPRYFCKGCRRYWTHGGTLRNVPVGGGCRKSKRPKLSATSTSTVTTTVTSNPLPPPQATTITTPSPTVPFYGAGSGGGGGGFLTSLVGQSVGFGPNMGLFHGLGLPSATEVAGGVVVENQEHVSFQELLQRRHESDVSSYQLSGSGSGRVPTNEGGGATSASWNVSNDNNNNNHWAC